jgi:hypothetical protein
MRIIYSYNTFGGKRFPSAFDMRLAKLSVTSLRTSTNYEPYLYTDLRGKDIFAELFDMDYINVVDFEFQNPAYWNTGKIEVYAMQKEPFLHVDFDTCFMKGFTIPEGDIITEKLRDYELTERLRKFSLDITYEPKKLICSGLVGIGKTNSLRVVERLSSTLQWNKNFLVNNPPFDELISLEEYVLSQIAEFLNYSVAQLDPRYFAHFQGEHKQERFGKIIDNLCKMYGI